jgi:hypothetical protein
MCVFAKLVIDQVFLGSSLPDWGKKSTGRILTQNLERVPVLFEPFFNLPDVV